MNKDPIIDLHGKTAIVTGGASGIGRAIAMNLAQCGAGVAVSDIDSAAVGEIARELAANGRPSIALQADVTDRRSVDQMIETILAQWKKLDIAVNNAGVLAAPGWDQREDCNDEDWELTFAVNVKGTVYVTEAVIPHFKKQCSGKIINIASVAGRQATAINPAYGASKASLISYTRSMAVALASYNINVNAVCPGLLWTPMWEQLGRRHRQILPELKEMSADAVFNHMVAKRIPMGRPQEPRDIANLVVFLASEASRNITGQSINVDGGSRTD